MQGNLPDLRSNARMESSPLNVPLVGHLPLYSQLLNAQAPDAKQAIQQENKASAQISSRALDNALLIAKQRGY